MNLKGKEITLERIIRKLKNEEAKLKSFIFEKLAQTRDSGETW